MLFYLNDKRYDQDALNERWQTLERNDNVASARRLAVCTTDHFEWLAIALYCRKNNLSVAPIHPDTPHCAAQRKAKELDCDALIWQNAEQIQRLCQSALPAGTLIQFSSGTTGAAKKIERTWAEIDREIEHYNSAINLTSDIVPVVACAITHSYGFICGFLASLARGATPHIVTGWNPKYLLHTLQLYPKPLLYSSPVFIKTLLMLWRSPQSLYGVMTSGAVMPEHDFANLTHKVQHVWQQYGCSEAGCITIAYQPKNARVMGHALAHCQLLASSDSNAPAEVIVQQSGHNIHTGDAGYIDSSDNSSLHFCGRIDDTIIYAGLNVYPQEVESALMTHPAISEAVVFNMPDASAGARVAAIYTAPSALNDTQLRDLYRQKLATHQRPSWTQYVTKIPRLANGKISRRQLAQDFLEKKPSTQPDRLSPPDTLYATEGTQV
ncbi:AMP-binding protein [uncultured Gilvimarinus sp.]|uniref:AMP-binding protein n=1 Tax=uncultured Gilvimarinus sp. TaxID=1689143 RepID=UPI0030D75D63